MPLPPINISGPLSLQTPARLEPARYARNGLVPHAIFETDLGAAVNFTAAVRNKNLFTWTTPIASIPSSAGSARTRWRFAAHTSPALRRIRAIVYMATQASGDSASPEVTLTLTDATEATTYGSATANFGASASGSTDVPSNFSYAEMIIDGVPADMDIFGKIEDSIKARVIAITVFEESLTLSSGNGYVLPSQTAVTAPIYDQRRQDIYELATLLWKRGAAHLMSWTVDNQASPITNASATPKNLVDTSVTAISASTPGWTLDLRYCRTVAQSTVPCVFWVYAKMSGAADTGEVDLLDSGGAPVAAVAVSGTTAQWYSTTANLPATESKYDAQFANPDFGSGAETISVYACSLYQYA